MQNLDINQIVMEPMFLRQELGVWLCATLINNILMKIIEIIFIHQMIQSCHLLISLHDRLDLNLLSLLFIGLFLSSSSNECDMQWQHDKLIFQIAYYLFPSRLLDYPLDSNSDS